MKLIKLRVRKGRHFATPIGIGSRIFRRFREVRYLITEWKLDYPYENNDSNDQNKLVGINLRGFKQSNVDSVMFTSSHDSRSGVTSFFAYQNNSDIRSNGNPQGIEFKKLFSIEGGRFNGVGAMVDEIEVSFIRTSHRYVQVEVQLYDADDNLIKAFFHTFRISKVAAKSRWFRTIALWFGGNNPAPVDDYSVVYVRRIL